MRIILSLCAVFATTSCKDATGDQKPKDVAKPAPVAATPDAAPARHQPIETTRDKMEQDRDEAKAEAAKTKDGQKGDRQDADWVPAEFKAGMSRWKDTGVYVDGKPMGFLTWGELPIGLKPTWVKDKVSAEKRPGTDDPGWRWAQQRFYKWVDYLKAIGIAPGSIKEIHVYGPKFSQTIIATGRDLMTPKAQGFMFRFGGNTFGKAIPQVPEGFGNGKTPDKVSSVMIYVKKKPPKLIPNEGLELDGVMQTGVPYYGEPIRGGVRIYLDDKLAAIIKRQELDAKKATKDADGNLQWRLADVLSTQGVDTKKVVEMWVIRDDKRTEKFPAADIESITFGASSQAKGGVMLNNKKVRANAIALHTRALKPEEIPVVTPDDD
jgi:hypothetical protein